MKEVYIPSTNNRNQLHVAIWEPERETKAILQISHGMVEYIVRYDDFAKHLNQQGILVIGNDHLGHGQSVLDESEFGYFGKEKGSAVVDDLYEVTKYAKKQYGENIPYFLMGHSMGSLMARRYLMTYGEKITGAIISGTGYKAAPVLVAALFFTAVTKLFHGERYRSPFLKWLAFHTYNRKIADVKTENDWLTRDAAVVAAYNENPYCKFSFTVNGYETLSDTIKYIQKQSNWEKTPKQLPILMIAGEEDPVGSYGKDVKKVYKKYQQLGCNHIELKLYQDDRHELVNELDREVVYADISQWILRWSQITGM